MNQTHLGIRPAAAEEDKHVVFIEERRIFADVWNGLADVWLELAFEVLTDGKSDRAAPLFDAEQMRARIAQLAKSPASSGFRSFAELFVWPPEPASHNRSWPE